MYVKCIERTSNRKCGDVAVTMAAQPSCWDRCPFRNAGCYAEFGPQGWITAGLNAAAPNIDHISIAKAEARAIHILSGRRPTSASTCFPGTAGIARWCGSGAW